METKKSYLETSLDESTRTSLVNKLQALPHKSGVNPDDWQRVHPNVLILADYLLEHCKEHMLPIIITSIIRPMIKGVSKTDIHSSGRAFDISVNGWSAQDIAFFVFRANEDLHIGAIALSDGAEREAVYEDGKRMGTAPHLHLQVRK